MSQEERIKHLEVIEAAARDVVDADYNSSYGGKERLGPALTHLWKVMLAYDEAQRASR